MDFEFKALTKDGLAAVSAAALLIVVGGVFVITALSVIIQVLSYRYRGGKRIFKMAPLHHHFELSGWSETKVVVRFWIVGALCALLTLAMAAATFIVLIGM